MQSTDRIVHLIREILKKTTALDNIEGGRRFNDPFDPYGWLIVLTLRGMKFTDRILHIIKETKKKTAFANAVSEGGGGKGGQKV